MSIVANLNAKLEGRKFRVLTPDERGNCAIVQRGEYRKPLSLTIVRDVFWLIRHEINGAAIVAIRTQDEIELFNAIIAELRSLGL